MNGGERGSSNGERVDRDAIDVAAVLARLDGEEPAVQREAVATVREAVDREPTACTPTIPKLRALLERPAIDFRDDVAYIFAEVAVECPSDIAPSVGTVVSILTSSSEPVRANAFRCLASVAATRPESVVDHVDEIAMAVADDLDERGFDALAHLSTHDPAVLVDVQPVLVDALETEAVDAEAVGAACSALGRLVRADPSASIGFVDRVVDLVEPPVDPTILADAVGCLGDVAHHHPAGVEEATPHIADALEASDVDARANAAIAISRIAAGAPTAVDHAEERLLDRLEDENPAVRRNAIVALVRGEVTAARGRFETLARGDKDPAVRECAKWALTELPEASTVG